MTRSALVEAAAEYLNKGLAVIALTGKMPNGKVHRHGLHEAIAGPVETADDWTLLEGAFDHADTTGVGILTNWPLVVVDIDGEEGAQQWHNLAEDDFMDATWVASTGRGLHLYYATPVQTGTIKLGPKLDLKGAGGYVVAPPSAHPDGRTYRWLRPPAAPLIEVPAPLAEVLAVRSRVAERAAVGKVHAKPIRGPKYTEGDTVFYAQSGFDHLIEAMANAEEGNRNNYLAWAAATIAEEGGEEEDFMALNNAAIKAGLDRIEVERTIRSGRRMAKRG